jgi:1-acyl-sn-glycerol-3-phosphate acyltransferase
MSLRPIEYVRSILSIFLFFILLVIFTPVIFLLLILSFGKSANFVVENIAPLIVKPVFLTAGISFNVKMYCEELTYPAVFIINHSSTLDLLTILALGLPRVRFVVKWQLQYNPVFFILGHLTGQIFIKRESSDKAVQKLQKTYKRIKSKQLSVLMAPEGTRKHPDVIGPFKKGPFRMAMDLNYPIVPVYFEGNRELSSGGFLFARSGTCTAHIHPPVCTDNWRLENLERHISEIRKKYLEWAGALPEKSLQK